MADIDKKFDIWKNKLLDMGKRNNLLNFHDTKRSTLEIKSPELYTLWNNFVIKEQPIVFPYANDITDEDDDSTVPTTIGDELITNQSVNDQQRTLRNLRNKAKTFMEEQGVNILYLSFGFINWNEAAHSKQYFEAPLVLVPVTISWESITSPFVLELHEDEIIVNPTLKYKMHTDFGIEIPEFSIDSNLSDYFDEIKALIKNNQWEFLPKVKLGLLSFLKINMYHDLEAHREEIMQHDVIRAIAGNTSNINADVSDLDNFDHDKQMSPSDVFHIVDADASQQDAILCASQGKSFILQGPPGTGKSQTITNIIAECLAEGKKVLFVSEKMAALEVVHRRLSAAGLADFCLIMHSHKANKKEILAQLENVLNLTQTRASVSDDAFQKLSELETDRKMLNEYSDEIFNIIQPLNKNIYEVNGYLAKLDNYADLIFSISDIRNITYKQYIDFVNILTQLKNNIGSKSGDFRKNPWYGAKADFVSNELRHDVNARTANIFTALDKLSVAETDMREKLSIKHELSYKDIDSIIKMLSLGACSPKAPFSWFENYDIDLLIKEANTCKSELGNILELNTKLHDLYDRLYKAGGKDFTSHGDILTYEQLKMSMNELNGLYKNDPVYSKWYESDNFNNIYNHISVGMKLIIEHRETKNLILETYEKDIFDIDYNAVFLRYKSEYNSFLKVFNSDYRKDKKIFAALHRERVKSLSDDEILDAIELLKDIDDISAELKENEPRMSRLLGELYHAENTDINEVKQKVQIFRLLKEYQNLLNEMDNSMSKSIKKETILKEHFPMYSEFETDWDNVLSLLNWSKAFKQEIGMFPDCQTFTELVCTSDETISECKVLSRTLSDIKNKLNSDLEWFINLFDDKSSWENLQINELKERIGLCVDNISELEKWIDYRNIRNKCIDIGLGDFINALESTAINAQDIIPVFQKRFFRLWLDSVLPDFPSVAGFRRRNQESLISEFRKLDKQQFNIAQARIRSKLIGGLPSTAHFTNGSDDISILKRELNKQKRIMPIRKLFSQIPDLILRLKPCLMMSPLSVSVFLEAENFKFDTVIFDEASQVCTENAIGAIFRGKQVIIAGDSRQLPPTSFFSAMAAGGDFDDDDDDELSAYDSILDEAALLPERTLLWHYRSRHEHLIAFSNAKIYKNRLITFPSNINRMKDFGVEYYHVKDGFYDRGGRRGNVIEAQKVADMVFEHFKKFGDTRSLGVIAFGEIQRIAIDTAIRKMRMENQQFEEFFNEDKKEPFFVKSLENVQGDERDTIIFSIGYAKDANGVMYMQFGPLSQSGGERRLNVAITRAKFNIKLVGSILPTDIDTDRVSAEGPKLLRSYIEFAMHGPEVLQNEITDDGTIQHDSPFEESVYNFLEKKGYKLATQVGCSGYRIDIAVKHPSISGRYVLGIECDGASYHSARTARERDRLRQDVLESMGWNIYRIWSTDWIKDPAKEQDLLIEAVDKAISEYVEDCPPEIPSEQEVEIAKADDFITIEEKEFTEEEVNNPYGLLDAKRTNFNILPKDSNGYVKMTDCIEMLIKNEYPIHYDLICQRVSPLLGREKVTSVVRKEVDAAISRMRGKVLKHGDFYYPIDYTEVPARKANGRPIKYISTDELMSAMLKVIAYCVGSTREGVIEETTRAYEFSRRGNNITIAMNTAYEQLLKDNKIIETDGKVSINK